MCRAGDASVCFNRRRRNVFALREELAQVSLQQDVRLRRREKSQLLQCRGQALRVFLLNRQEAAQLLFGEEAQIDCGFAEVQFVVLHLSQNGLNLRPVHETVTSGDLTYADGIGRCFDHRLGNCRNIEDLLLQQPATEPAA